ncbi:DUF1707 domain-containing protein [Corynebacterium sp. zg-331]|uniref:DUF1707 SHOCT-like domain-containing protein n=1 Tax=unclassified Corynebacterium TaxID=2624378 RepID=UPI00128D766F|nr:MULTISPECIES: DUF1707 domain-containing protein [unclassified Corynebacterium]MBC3185803.1 DUF1707 domain-containing protein [Corynebacterium sp. zg-331]MPV52296.1 DUF1707 domain-containing protein [Corynebacterium sp. zg331]
MSDRIRLSDEERTQAMSHLGTAFSQGRLSIDEYDARCQAAVRAQYRYELDALLSDLPAPLPQRADRPVEVYTAEEIEAARRQSRYPRAGILALTSILALCLFSIDENAEFFLLIPLVFVLLYVLKIGPASWHVPSQRALHRQRLQAIKEAERQRSLERKAQRLEIRHELKSSAYGFARNALQRRR